MPKPILIKGSAWEDTAATIRAQVADNLDELITTSNVSSITYSVYDAATPRALISGYDGVSITVADAVYDTLQTSVEDAGWDYATSTQGYNFRFVVPGSAFADPDEYRRVIFVFTPTSGESFKMVVDINAQGLLT